MRHAGKTLLISSGVGLLFLFGLWILFFPSPTRIYRASFGENPSSDVSHLQGTSSGGYDYQETKLRFEADFTTIQRLAKSQKLRLVTPSNFSHFKVNGSAGDAKPKIASRSLRYCVSGREGSFFHEDVSLQYDPQTRTAVYSFVGID